MRDMAFFVVRRPVLEAGRGDAAALGG